MQAVWGSSTRSFKHRSIIDGGRSASPVDDRKAHLLSIAAAEQAEIDAGGTEIERSAPSDRIVGFRDTAGEEAAAPPKSVFDNAGVAATQFGATKPSTSADMCKPDAIRPATAGAAKPGAGAATSSPTKPSAAATSKPSPTKPSAAASSKPSATKPSAAATSKQAADAKPGSATKTGAASKRQGATAAGGQPSLGHTRRSSSHPPSNSMNIGSPPKRGDRSRTPSPPPSNRSRTPSPTPLSQRERPSAKQAVSSVCSGVKNAAQSARQAAVQAAAPSFSRKMRESHRPPTWEPRRVRRARSGGEQGAPRNFVEGEQLLSTEGSMQDPTQSKGGSCAVGPARAKAASGTSPPRPRLENVMEAPFISRRNRRAAAAGEAARIEQRLITHNASQVSDDLPFTPTCHPKGKPAAKGKIYVASNRYGVSDPPPYSDRSAPQSVAGASPPPGVSPGAVEVGGTVDDAALRLQLRGLFDRVSSTSFNQPQPFPALIHPLLPP